jgi:hypothetical protein
VEGFNTIYEEKLAALAQVNLADKARALELGLSSGQIVVPLFGRPHLVSHRGIADHKGSETTPAVGSVLLDYILHNETQRSIEDPKVSFRDFTGAGPLVSSFTNNTNHLIAHSFSGRLEDLETACRKLSGSPLNDSVAADLHVKFIALPKIPIYLNFNDREEELPAQCNLLFEKSAESYLALQSCFVLGTYLTGNLI